MMHFILILVALVTVTEQRKSMTFNAMMSPNGTNVCAVDSPSVTELMSLGSVVKCGVECMEETSCKAFNYHADVGNCDIYNTVPSQYNVISGCTGYKGIFDCSIHNGGCDQLCNSTAVSLTCSCRDGHRLEDDGRTCTEINECTINNGGCGPLALCTNTIGGFFCTCPLQSDGSCNVSSNIGCWYDTVPRDLTGITYVDMSNNTRIKCRSFCFNLGYLYAGAQFGSHCFCGSRYGLYQTASNCDYACTGDATSVCGGFNANSLMYTGVVGCYADTSQSRDLSGSAVNDSANTLSRCRTYCSNQNYKFAGAQSGNMCFCGNTFGRYGNSSACNTACNGATNTKCGGVLANTIMFTGN